MKKYFSIMIFICLILISSFGYAEELLPIEYNKYTDEYIEYINLSEKEKSKIIIPRKYKFIQEDENNVPMLKANRFESRYNLKDKIPENVKIKNQLESGTCWTFSSLVTLETNLALNNYKLGKNEKVYDFSELHMEYASSHIFKNGKTKKPYGYDRNLGVGGNFNYASSYLMNGEGPIDESALPFEDFSKIPGYIDLFETPTPQKSSIIDIENIENKQVTARVYETVEYPALTDSTDINILIDKIKAHIKNYGALDSSIYTETYNTNNVTGAIYEPFKAFSNHAIAIIGWDDNYDVSNFNKKYQPQNPGAWIIKNSWGERVGDSGFFYVSYEDKHIYKSLNGIVSANDKIDYDYIYEYDYLYPSYFFQFSDYTGNMATNATIGQEFDKKSNDIEYLNEVSFYAAQSCIAEIYVGKDKNNLQKMVLEDGQTIKQIEDVGYKTFKFQTPVMINTDKFFVAIKLNAPSGIIIATEQYNPNEYSFYKYAKMEKNKCFYTETIDDYKSAYWNDLSAYSIGDSSIKAYTTETNLKNTFIELIDENIDKNQNDEKSDLPFVDVLDSAWYYNYVSYVYNNGIILGTSKTTFSPNEKLSRAMIVTILHRLENYPNVEGKSKFLDVQNANKYYYNAVKWASYNGIVNGYLNGNFGPNDNIKRQDLAIILKNYAEYKGKNTNIENNLNNFVDTNNISNYAMQAMKWAVGAGIISGNKDKTLAPRGATTRAESAAMIERFCKQVLK